MKFFAGTLSVLALLSAPAFAQGGYRPPPAPAHQENLSFGYAQVLRVVPVFENYSSRTPDPGCDTHRSGGDPTGGTVIGAIVGGALGNQVGKGDGRKAATVAGVVAGAAIGRSIDKNNGSAPAYDCRNAYAPADQRRIAGYDVEYTYKGEHYMSRLPYDPGNHLRVRVSVTPDDSIRQ